MMGPNLSKKGLKQPKTVKKHFLYKKNLLAKCTKIDVKLSSGYQFILPKPRSVGKLFIRGSVVFRRVFFLHESFKAD
jgi:hypothetical protein